MPLQASTPNSMMLILPNPLRPSVSVVQPGWQFSPVTVVLICRCALGWMVPSLPVICEIARGDMSVVPVMLRTEVGRERLTAFVPPPPVPSRPGHY